MSDKHIETVNHLKKKLDKGVSFEKTMHILYKLQKIPISVELLKETGIGYKLRELSKQEKNNDVGKTAKLIIMTWKQFLKEQQDEQQNDDNDDDNQRNYQKHHQQDDDEESDNDEKNYRQKLNGNNDDDDDDDDDDDEDNNNNNNNNDNKDDEEMIQYGSDNRSEESVSPHHININCSNQKKKHKKKKKSRSKENDGSDDDRKEKKKDKKRKHREYNNTEIDTNGYNSASDNLKRYRTSTTTSTSSSANNKCDNDESSHINNYSNGNMINDYKRKQSKQQETATTSMKQQQQQNTKSTIISCTNNDDMFSSMLNMSDHALVNKKNERIKQSTSTSSSFTSNFDKEMMQSLNLSAKRYDPNLYYQSSQKSSNDEFDNKQSIMMANMAGMKFKGRTQVYAGSSKSVTVPKVYRLQDICIKVLMNHVNKIYEVGDLPYFILKPVFAKCTVQQLRRIEHYNPQLLEDTDELWRDFCEKDFKNKRIDRNHFDSWRDFYSYLIDEREEKLKNITKNINSKQRQAIPERKTQQLEGIKTPREIRRRQERNFNFPISSSSSSLSKSTTMNKSIGSSIKASLSSSTAPISNKSKPAPLMKKLLQMRHSKFRR